MVAASLFSPLQPGAIFFCARRWSLCSEYLNQSEPHHLADQKRCLPIAVVVVGKGRKMPFFSSRQKGGDGRLINDENDETTKAGNTQQSIPDTSPQNADAFLLMKSPGSLLSQSIRSNQVSSFDTEDNHSYASWKLGMPWVRQGGNTPTNRPKVLDSPMNATASSSMQSPKSTTTMISSSHKPPRKSSSKNKVDDDHRYYGGIMKASSSETSSGHERRKSPKTTSTTSTTLQLP